MPEVSVVLSAYNAEATLDEAIASLTAQSFRDVEFILVDDGSSDRTASIIQAHADRDPRIKPLLFAENRRRSMTVSRRRPPR